MGFSACWVGGYCVRKEAGTVDDLCGSKKLRLGQTEDEHERWGEKRMGSASRHRLPLSLDFLGIDEKAVCHQSREEETCTKR